MPTSVLAHLIQSPIGPIRLVADERAIRQISFVDDLADSVSQLPEQAAPTELLARAAEQIRAYFARERQTFDLPLAPEGTAFQQRVWAELRRVPFGETITYATLARQIGDALAVRAIGRANAENPIAIVVPCHRVIGTGGKMTGYDTSLERKRWLLAFEGTTRGQGVLF